MYMAHYPESDHWMLTFINMAQIVPQVCVCVCVCVCDYKQILNLKYTQRERVLISCLCSLLTSIATKRIKSVCIKILLRMIIRLCIHCI